MRPVSVTVSSQVASQTIPLEYQAETASFVVNLTAGATLTYSVQVTNDNVFDPTVTPSWQDLTALSGKSASANASVVGSYRAARLNVSAYTTGSATLTVVQQSC